MSTEGLLAETSLINTFRYRQVESFQGATNIKSVNIKFINIYLNVYFSMLCRGIYYIYILYFDLMIIIV